MQHDAIGAAVLTDGKSVAGKLVGITRPSSTRKCKADLAADLAAMPASHGRSFLSRSPAQVNP
jgi:hypothetical protein